MYAKRKKVERHRQQSVNYERAVVRPPASNMLTTEDDVETSQGRHCCICRSTCELPLFNKNGKLCVRAPTLVHRVLPLLSGIHPVHVLLAALWTETSSKRSWRSIVQSLKPAASYWKGHNHCPRKVNLGHWNYHLQNRDRQVAAVESVKMRMGTFFKHLKRRSEMLEWLYQANAVLEWTTHFFTGTSTQRYSPQKSSVFLHIEVAFYGHP